jgi:hypothetical protein
MRPVLTVSVHVYLFKPVFKFRLVLYSIYVRKKMEDHTTLFKFKVKKIGLLLNTQAHKFLDILECLSKGVFVYSFLLFLLTFRRYKN